MSRRTLTDRQGERIEERVPGKRGDRGATGRDDRLSVDAVLWIARTAAPWRDPPPEFGRWNSVWRRFTRWAAARVWQGPFEALVAAPTPTSST